MGPEPVKTPATAAARTTARMAGWAGLGVIGSAKDRRKVMAKAVKTPAASLSSLGIVKEWTALLKKVICRFYSTSIPKAVFINCRSITSFCMSFAPS